DPPPLHPFPTRRSSDLSPELIFNTAEGRRGRFREAFYPALFDELGFPYTGSDAWVLAVTLDKSLTKLMLSEHGVISPRGQFIDRSEEHTSELQSPCNLV